MKYDIEKIKNTILCEDALLELMFDNNLLYSIIRV